MEAEITTEKIQNAVSKIVAAFKPEKIILFGSWAWGTPGPDSDVDLLVVKETQDTRAESREISRMLFPRSFPIDVLVYRPRDLEQKIKEDRNLFLEDIVTNGKVLYASH